MKTQENTLSQGVIGLKMTSKLLDNIEKVHTTEMGLERIKKNLKLDNFDIVEYCKEKIQDKNCVITRKGKNWYCEIENNQFTINSYCYTIITAHRKDK